MFLLKGYTLNESKCAREAKYIKNYFYMKRLSIAWSYEPYILPSAAQHFSPVLYVCID